MTNNEILIPIVASILTLILTKLFDVFMARRKEGIEAFSQSLSTVDEIATAARETIIYLKAELSACREENKLLRQELADKNSKKE